MAGTKFDDVLFFEGFRLDRRAGGLFRADPAGGSIPVALGSRALELLALLASRRGEAVSKDDILTVVWSGRAVEEANLNVQISKLRHVLDQGRACGSCIQTITGYGYRFVADVTPTPAPVRPAAASPGGDENPYSNEAAGGPSTAVSEGRDHVPNIARPFGLRPSLASWPPQTKSEYSVGRALTDTAENSVLISRLGADGTIDHDLALRLVGLRQRLIDEYGDGVATSMLVDLVIAAYRDFVRVTGWVANASIAVEHELFAVDGMPEAENRDGADRSVAHQVPEHFWRLRETLIPLADSCGCRLRDVLGALEAFCPAPNRGRRVDQPRRPVAVVQAPMFRSEFAPADQIGWID